MFDTPEPMSDSGKRDNEHHPAHAQTTLGPQVDIAPDRLEIKVLTQIHRDYRLYLLLSPPKATEPTSPGSSTLAAGQLAPQEIAQRLVRLGTGRNSVVFLASNAPQGADAYNETFVAVKFLKKDPDPGYTTVSERRFLEEAAQTQTFGSVQTRVVNYEGWGVILPSEADAADWRPRGTTPKAQGHYSTGINTGEVFAAIMQMYGLQGPFYALELAGGTLYDMLERAIPWSELPAYRLVPRMANGVVTRQALLAAAENVQEDLKQIRAYFDADDLYGKSGYDILNLFRTDPHEPANAVRNNAVLGLFVEIASTVASLHTREQVMPRNLTHRDLKPGNVFVFHGFQEKDIGKLETRLGDLGYLADFLTLQSPEFTGQGVHNPAATVPGSQFYRAPEQSEPMMEVRISYDPAHHTGEAGGPYKVSVRSTKLMRIQAGDRLLLSDFFVPGREREQGDSLPVFRIHDVMYHPEHRNVVAMTIDQPIQTQTHNDLVAFVVRATGYHTDGYSLGAMLYDLASGGKSPEFFYTYCLIRFSEEFSGRRYTTDMVVDALCPSDTNLVVQATPLPNRWLARGISLKRRWKYIQLVLAARDFDELVDNIIRHALGAGDTQVDRAALKERLEDYKFREFDIVNDLLHDRRGVPIHKEIIRLIVKCMLRNLDGSYYHSHVGHGFVNRDNYEAVNDIVRDIRKLMAEHDFALPTDFPKSLQGDDLLFKLRAFGSALGPAEIPSPKAAPAQPVRTTGLVADAYVNEDVAPQ